MHFPVKNKLLIFSEPDSVFCGSEAMSEARVSLGFIYSILLYKVQYFNSTYNN